MNPINQTTYYIEEHGWFTSSLKPVTREAFMSHQSEKRAVPTSLIRVIQALALSILAATQSMRFPMGGSPPGVQVTLPALSLHLWSQIPTVSAQSTPLIPITTPTAPPGPQGDEFQINTYTKGSQRKPSVAALAGGGFVVAWSSAYQDGSNGGVYGQRFDSAGAKVGSEFPINTYTKGYQGQPSVAAFKLGGFVVAWESWEQDGSGPGIYGQRVESGGAKLGSEFQVNTYTLGGQSKPAVAALWGEGFVVIWTSNGQDGSSDGIYAQRFDVSGAKVGSEFQVNTYTGGDQGQPSVAALAGGALLSLGRARTKMGPVMESMDSGLMDQGRKWGANFPSILTRQTVRTTQRWRRSRKEALS